MLDKDYSIMLENIKEFQVRVLHNLTSTKKPGEVDNTKLLTLVQTQRILHQLKDLSFEDSGLREIIRDLYKTNYAVLHKYGLDGALYQELSQSPNLVDPNEVHFSNLVDKHVKDILAEYKNKEEQELSNHAKDIAECLLLGIPRKYLKTSQETGEEHLHKILQSIHQEEQINKAERAQDLSLFSNSKTLAKYKECKQQSLNETLDSVADCVVRNHEKEKLLSQKRRG